jgi:hypothetical protein
MTAEIVDLESRVVDADHQALKLWLRLLACTTRIENTVRQRLREEFARRCRASTAWPSWRAAPRG